MPLKQKLEIEEKVRIIREYLQGKISLCEGARESGVAGTTFRGWISIYENQGVEGFTQERNQKYTVELKTAAVIDYQRGGGSLAAICKKYKIKDTIVMRYNPIIKRKKGKAVSPHIAKAGLGNQRGGSIV